MTTLPRNAILQKRHRKSRRQILLAAASFSSITAITTTTPSRPKKRVEPAAEQTQSPGVSFCPFQACPFFQVSSIVFCPSICALSICIYLCLYLSMHLSVCLSVCLSPFSLSTSVCIYPSLYLFVCLSIYLFIYLFSFVCLYSCQTVKQLILQKKRHVSHFTFFSVNFRQRFRKLIMNCQSPYFVDGHIL